MATKTDAPPRKKTAAEWLREVEANQTPAVKLRAVAKDRSELADFPREDRKRPLWWDAWRTVQRSTQAAVESAGEQWPPVLDRYSRGALEAGALVLDAMADRAEQAAGEGLPLPIANVALAKAAGLQDPDGVSRQMRAALAKARHAYRKVTRGRSRQWTEAELRAAAQHLPDGRLKNLLRRHRFRKPD